MAGHFDRLVFAGTGHIEVRGRAQTVECLRIASAFGIVAFHAHAGLIGEIGYAGLTVFLLLSVYFEVKSAANDLFSLAGRLLIPWGIWFVIFSILNLFSKTPSQSVDVSLFERIFYGPSPHLWFLPFAFLATLAVRLIKQHVEGWRLGLVAGLACLVFAFSEDRWRPWSFTMPHPIPEYMFGGIPVLYGIVLAASLRIGIGLLGVLVSLAVWNFASPEWDTAGIQLIGLIASTAAILTRTLKLPRVINPNSLSRYMFGVYLSHPIFLHAAHIIDRLWPLTSAIVAFALSVLFTWLCSGRATEHWARWRSRPA